MRNEDIRIGQHCWALCGDKLLVVLKTGGSDYEVCGAWECGAWESGIIADYLEILEIIDRPAGYEKAKLYYLKG